MWISQDGVIVGAEGLALTVESDAARYGRSVFETARTAGGRIPLWEKHAARLQQGCDVLGLPHPGHLTNAPENVWELLARHRLDEGRVRVTAFGTGSGATTLVVTVHEVSPPPRSMRCTFADFPRNEKSPLSGIKSGNYAECLLAWERARVTGYDEALFLNTAGRVCEGSRHNLFVLQGDRLITPDLASGPLPGIVRGWVLEAARQAGWAVEERPVEAAEVEACEEMFLTNSVSGIVPVTALEERTLTVGERTATLREKWEAFTDGYRR